MVEENLNGLEKAILSSDFVKNHPKLAKASDKKKLRIAGTKIKRDFIGLFRSAFPIKEEEFSGYLIENGFVSSLDEYKKIFSEDYNQETKMKTITLRYNGTIDPFPGDQILFIDKDHPHFPKAIYLDCYDPEAP